MEYRDHYYYTVDENGLLQPSETQVGHCYTYEFTVGKNSFYIHGRSEDCDIFRGSGTMREHRDCGEFRTQPAVVVSNIFRFNAKPDKGGKLWCLDGVTAKLGKLLLKNYPLPDVMLNIALGFFKSKYGVKIEVRKDVVDTYTNGYGVGSCMTGPDRSQYMKVLEDNKVKILTAQKGNNKARALVWPLESGEMLLDRIYPNDSPLISAIHSYAKENSYWIRSHQSCPCDTTTFMKEGEQKGHFEFSMTAADNSLYPYLDSFHWGTKEDSGFKLNTSGAGDCRFASTEGRYAHSACPNCTGYNEVYPCHDGVSRCGNCTFVCSITDGRYALEDRGELNGFTTSDGWVCQTALEAAIESGDLVLVRQRSHYFPKRKCAQCHSSGKWHLKDDLIKCAESDNLYYGTCDMVRTNRGRVHQDNLANYEDVAGTMVHKDDKEKYIETGGRSDASNYATLSDYLIADIKFWA